MTTPTYKGHAKDCAILAKGGELQCNCGMTTPTPSNALVNVLAEWEDKNGTMAAIMPDEWAGLMRPVMNACMIQSPRQIRRELAAAQERIERLEACVNGEVPEGALKALGRWLAPVLDEDKWATAEKFLNAALLQLLDAREALKAAEARAERYRKAVKWFTEQQFEDVAFFPPESWAEEHRAAIDAAMREPK